MNSINTANNTIAFTGIGHNVSTYMLCNKYFALDCSTKLPIKATFWAILCVYVSGSFKSKDTDFYARNNNNLTSTDQTKLRFD